MKPFRWDLSKREQLGRLLDGRTAALDSDTASEVATATAKAVARSDNGDLYFVGRTLHASFDFLCGVFSGTPYAERIHLLPLSVRDSSIESIEDPKNVRALRELLTGIGLSMPLSKHQRVAFVDFVDTGGTFEILVAAMSSWARDEGVLWEAVKPKLRFVGVVFREKSSPNTWRWQQQRSFTDLISDSQIKSVSIDGTVLGYLAADQKKTNATHVADRWTNPESAHHDDKTLDGLAEAVAWYDYGKSAAGRILFKKVLHDEPFIREQWLRSLSLLIR